MKKHIIFLLFTMFSLGVSAQEADAGENSSVVETKVGACLNWNFGKEGQYLLSPSLRSVHNNRKEGSEWTGYRGMAAELYFSMPLLKYLQFFADVELDLNREAASHLTFFTGVGSSYSFGRFSVYGEFRYSSDRSLNYIDADRLGCVGASYGGYSVYYLAGHHDKRFKAFIAHCGIFDLKMQYFTTEEMWFANWDMGGAPWEKNNKVAQRTFANSPDMFVGNWDTPILVIHGQKDFRIDVSQGMAAFNAARMRGIPAQFLYFPNECHWVTGCQDGILWQRTFKAWLDKWLKDN